MNVIEIDAASNNGVDNIREIREEVTYRPTEGKYKVYIIDEVHMLSIGAFNALLKTLEEPPEYVIFILATTEVHKIPITILSRCQQYDFHRISLDTIAARLQELMEKEQVDVEERAIRYVAKAADGSMRDALSLLDQCIAFYLGQTLTYENVLDVLGAVDTEVFSRLLRNVLKRDIPKVMDTVDELIMQGRELSQLAADFTWYLRNLLLAKTSDQLEDVLEVSSENLEQLKEESEMIEVDQLLRYIRIFSELSGQLKYATQKRVMLEVALIKLCIPAMESDTLSILDRIRVVEDKIEKGMVVAPAGYGAQGQMGANGLPMGENMSGGTVGGADGPAAGAGTQKPAELPKAIPEDIREVVQNFRAIVRESRPPLKICLGRARLSLGGDNRLLLVFSDAMDAELAGTKEHLKELEDLIAEQIGKEVEVEVRCAQDNTAAPVDYPDLEQLIHMEITVED